jgi:hypothetical protein
VEPHGRDDGGWTAGRAAPLLSEGLLAVAAALATVLPAAVAAGIGVTVLPFLNRDALVGSGYVIAQRQIITLRGWLQGERR